MNDARKKHELALATRRKSLIHSYDGFLTAQTRLFTLAHYVYSNVDGDVEGHQEQLFFDDLISFAIASRRLVELAGVKSFANHVKINEHIFDEREAPLKLSLSGTKIGFLKFVSSVIHAKYIDLLRSRLDFWSYRGGRQEKDTFALYNLLAKVRRENRWAEYAVDVSVLVVTDDDELTLVKLKDVIDASSKVIERIADKCGEVGIHLELEYRKID